MRQLEGRQIAEYLLILCYTEVRNNEFIGACNTNDVQLKHLKLEVVQAKIIDSLLATIQDNKLNMTERVTLSCWRAGCK